MENKKRTVEWLVKWFKNNGEFKCVDIEDHLNENYFEMEYIDSFLFIQLISDIEQEFEIEFRNDQFQDRRFATIDGLADCIVDSGK